jgi:UPF0042 nucleotide-binding protein
MRLVLVSGLSGSGKSIALAVLEDIGYYCMDNVPVALLPGIVEHLDAAGQERVAVSVDARSGEEFDQLPVILDHFRERGVDVKLVFLEAKVQTLVQRFSETRRKHPLSDGYISLAEAINIERARLEVIAARAHRIDTSELPAQVLRAWIKDLVAQDRAPLTLLFESFGFKRGIPMDADLVFDVRCLPNPHYESELRPLSGLDEPVRNYIEASEDAMHMLADIRAFIESWLPCFVRDHRAYLTVAIGCTGGQHRSVYFATRLGEHFKATQQVLVRHRGLGR